MIEIREAQRSDLPALTAIHNHYIETTPITFDVVAFTVEQRQAWFDGFATSGRHRLLVALWEARPIGYAGSHCFRAKDAYDPSVETTIYLDPEARGAGVGRALYAALFDILGAEDVHRAYAGVTLPNDASKALHLGFGFESVGVFREVGRKFDRFWDVEWFEKAL